MHLDDLIALSGLVLFLTGLYLWLGLPAPLMILGLAMIYAGARLPIEEPDNDKSN